MQVKRDLARAEAEAARIAASLQQHQDSLSSIKELVKARLLARPQTTPSSKQTTPGKLTARTPLVSPKPPQPPTSTSSRIQSMRSMAALPPGVGELARPVSASGAYLYSSQAWVPASVCAAKHPAADTDHDSAAWGAGVRTSDTISSAKIAERSTTSLRDRSLSAQSEITSAVEAALLNALKAGAYSNTDSVLAGRKTGMQQNVAPNVQQRTSHKAGGGSAASEEFYFLTEVDAVLDASISLQRARPPGNEGSTAAGAAAGSDAGLAALAGSVCSPDVLRSAGCMRASGGQQPQTDSPVASWGEGCADSEGGGNAQAEAGGETGAAHLGANATPRAPRPGMLIARSQAAHHSADARETVQSPGMQAHWQPASDADGMSHSGPRRLRRLGVLVSSSEADWSSNASAHDTLSKGGTRGAKHGWGPTCDSAAAGEAELGVQFGLHHWQDGALDRRRWPSTDACIDTWGDSMQRGLPGGDTGRGSIHTGGVERALVGVEVASNSPPASGRSARPCTLQRPAVTCVEAETDQGAGMRTSTQMRSVSPESTSLLSLGTAATQPGRNWQSERTETALPRRARSAHLRHSMLPSPTEPVSRSKTNAFRVEAAGSLSKLTPGAGTPPASQIPVRPASNQGGAHHHGGLCHVHNNVQSHRCVLSMCFAARLVRSAYS